MVYGWASTPDLDSDGEIVSLKGLEKALPNYLQFPTLREMHQPKAAGTVKHTDIKKENDVEGLYIGAKVVAEDAWNLVKEGVYRGFSIGGNVVSKVGNVINDLDLVEISLVDVPANKKAKIEVWKAGKITKDAETVYSLSNLMITLKDTIMYFEAIGKPTKDLEKALETIKKVIGEEALETEKESEQRREDMWSEMMMADNPEDIKKLIKSLDRISFDEGSTPEMLRKVVKINMAKKLEKQEEVETPEVEVEESEKEEVDVPESSEEETVEETVETEEGEEVEDSEESEDAEEETPEGEDSEEEETKETSANPELTKLDTIADKLEKLETKEEVVKTESPELVKMVGHLEKMADILEGFEKRLAKLESEPAPLKSKQAYVELKKGEEIDKGETKVDPDSDLGKKLARMNELNDLYEKLGRHEFAKRGFSMEAGKLKDEIERLQP